MASTGVSLTDTDIEVFSGRVLTSYQHRDYFGEELLMFQGMTAGEIVNQPIMEENATGAQNLADGGDHDDEAVMVGHEVQLTLPIKSFSDILKTQVDVRPDLSLIENVGAQVGRDVGIGRTLRISNYLLDQAVTATQTRALTLAPSSAVTVGEQVAHVIEIVAAEFDDAGIPDDQRYMFMKPTHFYALRALPNVISSDFTQGQNINQAIGGNMSVLNYLNFTIRNMGSVFGTNWLSSLEDGKNLPTQTSTGHTNMRMDQTTTVALAWHTGSTIVRHQTGLQASIDWIQRQQVWMSIARLHMGIKTVKPEGVFAIVTV
jgi:hypothetical protein